jgi:D-methionine transport system ATP-binding protein
MGDAILRTEKLTKVFPGRTRGEENLVLDNIDLEIRQGEVFGVIGRSGAGKSTFVRCVNYLERPTSGEIVFDGTRLSGLTNRELYAARRSMGMIFQQFNLLLQRDSIGNVMFPFEIAHWDRKKARARAAELLGLVGMEEKINSYPSQLSGGQQQRVAIARAIALSPKVLLCDEATSALDPETTRDVLELLRTINREQGITIVIITHAMSVVRHICDRVAVLSGGRVVESGSVAEVFGNPQATETQRIIRPGGLPADEEEYRYVQSS